METEEIAEERKTHRMNVCQQNKPLTHEMKYELCMAMQVCA